MGQDSIFEKLLEDYGLRENHILIMKAVQDKELTAEEICSKTGIPRGRVYEFLNFLVDNKLIKATGTHPNLYTAKPLTKRVREFLTIKFQEQIDKEKLIESLMENDKPRIIPINNDQDFIFWLRKALVKCNKLKILTAWQPHLFYTNNNHIFMKFSQNVYDFSVPRSPIKSLIIKDAFWKAYKNANPAYYIIDKSTIEKYKLTLRENFTPEERDNILSIVKKHLEDGLVKMFISKVKNPAYMVITDNQVFLTMLSMQTSVGVCIQNTEIARAYDTMYDEQITRCENVLTIWDKIFGK